MASKYSSYKAVGIVVLTLLSISCSSTKHETASGSARLVYIQNQIERSDKLQQQIYNNTSRELSVRYYPSIRRGASIEKGGNHHVLSYPLVYVSSSALDSQNSTDAKLRNEKPVKDFVTGAWQKYCNFGIGLNAKEWTFIAKANYKIPLSYQSKCHPPK